MSMSTIPKYTDAAHAAELITRNGEEFAVVENPSYVFPPYDIYPLSRKAQTLDGALAGAVMDMDGTTTTTEPLCIHSLEMMVRRITGREHDTAWPGLNPERDYPHIIGNSTTKHVEYLIRTYRDDIQDKALQQFYIYGAAWTLGKAADEGRRKEVANTCAALGIGALLKDSRFVTLQKAHDLDDPEARTVVDALAAEYGPKMAFTSVSAIVRAAIDIYYQRYHFILALLDSGKAQGLNASILGDPHKHLICAMPGIGVYLALIKGWLGDDADQCYGILRDHLVKEGMAAADVDALRPRLASLGKRFAAKPAAVGVVTSSIYYEANIVLNEVFRVIREELAGWDISPALRARLAEGFSSPSAYYDGIITASDSSEIRLKPHRDLYSIALHQLGISPEDFNKVAGFEDSESGTIAIRAAGIPVCCALPFHETRNHTFTAATHVAQGGIPEVILVHNAFLPEE
jgi:beta-phosphoglucomutase-like phosphatase (HAD superfamily)